jgi:hypothetical protein
VAHEPDGPNVDQGTRLILTELRDLRREMRADRQEAKADRQEAKADRQEAKEERRQSDDRFAQVMREFREDSARREAATQDAFREIRTVGLSIVKTLNRHTRILEKIERHLGARNNGRPGRGNGRDA